MPTSSVGGQSRLTGPVLVTSSGTVVGSADTRNRNFVSGGGGGGSSVGGQSTNEGPVLVTPSGEVVGSADTRNRNFVSGSAPQKTEAQLVAENAVKILELRKEAGTFGQDIGPLTEYSILKQYQAEQLRKANFSTNEGPMIVTYAQSPEVFMSSEKNAFPEAVNPGLFNRLISDYQDTNKGGEYLFEKMGVTNERINLVSYALTKDVGGVLPSYLYRPQHTEVLRGAVEGILLDIKQKPVKNVVLLGAGFAFGLGTKAVGQAVELGLGTKALQISERALIIGGTALGITEVIKIEIESGGDTRKLGQGLGVAVKDVVVFSAGAYEGSQSFNKIYNYIRNIDLPVVETKSVVAPEYFEGQRYPAIRRGQTAGELQAEFYKNIPELGEEAVIKLSGYSGKGEIIKNIDELPFTKPKSPSRGFHAASHTFEASTTAGAGSSEVKGLPIAPLLSPKFLRISSENQVELFSFTDILKTSKPTAIRLEVIDVELAKGVKPSQANLRKFDIELIKQFGGSPQKHIDFGEPRLPKGKAYIPFIKTEKEAYLVFESPIENERLAQFKFEGRRVTILKGTSFNIKSPLDMALDLIGKNKMFTLKQYSSYYKEPKLSYSNPLVSGTALSLSSMKSSSRGYSSSSYSLSPSYSRSYNIPSYSSSYSAPSYSSPSSYSASSLPSYSGSYSSSVPKSPPSYPPYYPPRQPPYSFGGGTGIPSFSLKGYSPRRKKSNKYRSDIIYVPDFTSKALGLTYKTSRKSFEAKIRMPKFGLESRRIPVFR